MTPAETLLPLLAGLVLGLLIGVLYLRGQAAATEARYRAELEAWKLESADGIRRDSVNRSRSTLKGKIAEQMAPLLAEFPYNPADARFLGSPVDYIIFDGLTAVADERAEEIRIVVLDVKHGTAGLSRTQRVIRDAVAEKKVLFETLRVP